MSEKAAMAAKISEKSKMAASCSESSKMSAVPSNSSLPSYDEWVLQSFWFSSGHFTNLLTLHKNKPRIEPFGAVNRLLARNQKELSFQLSNQKQALELFFDLLGPHPLETDEFKTSINLSLDPLASLSV